MSLYFLDAKITVRRITYIGDAGSLATVFTNVLSSIQQEDVAVEYAGDGYANRSYVVYMDNEQTIRTDDRLITPDGVELRVLGVKLVTSGGEDYQQIDCAEGQD